VCVAKATATIDWLISATSLPFNPLEKQYEKKNQGSCLGLVLKLNWKIAGSRVGSVFCPDFHSSASVIFPCLG